MGQGLERDRLGVRFQRERERQRQEVRVLQRGEEKMIDRDIGVQREIERNIDGQGFTESDIQG